MTLLAGSIAVDLSANTKDLNQGFDASLKKIDQFAGQAEKKMGGLKGIFDISIGNVLADTASNAFSNIGTKLDTAKTDAMEYEKSMISLGIISEKFGTNQDLAKKKADELGKSLKIGPTAASAGLANLLKSGLNLEQASDLMARFNNEALTGKSAGISQAQAVENLSFAYATNSSAIGNLSGISENYDNIIKQGRQSLIAKGVATKDITEEQAKYQGMIDLTNITLGSSEKLNGSIIDIESQKQLAYAESSRMLGEKLQPAFMAFDLLQISLIENGMKLGQFLSDNQEIMIGLGVTVGILSIGLAYVLAPSLWAVAVAGWAAIAPFLPFIAIAVGVGAAIGGLAYVWNKNMFGIQDTTKKVFDAIGVAVKWGIDGVKSNINKGIDAINGLIDGVNAIATNAGLPTIGKIPKFRSGVANFEGGFAKIHEGETIKYLPKGTDVDTRNETMNNERGQSGQSNITINIPNGSFIDAQSLDDFFKKAKTAAKKQGFQIA